MDEALLVRIAAIGSGFAREGEWVAWADDWITRLGGPPLWLCHVCAERTPCEALAVLYPTCASVAHEVWDRLDGTGLRLGFLYLAIVRDGSGELELLLKADDLADRANFRAGCEAFYLLADEVEGRESLLKKNTTSEYDPVTTNRRQPAPSVESTQQNGTALAAGWMPRYSENVRSNVTSS